MTISAITNVTDDSPDAALRLQLAQLALVADLTVRPQAPEHVVKADRRAVSEAQAKVDRARTADLYL